MGDQPIEVHEPWGTWLRGRGVWLVAVSTDEDFHVPLWGRLRIHFDELLGQAILDGRADRIFRVIEVIKAASAPEPELQLVRVRRQTLLDITPTAGYSVFHLGFLS